MGPEALKSLFENEAPGLTPLALAVFMLVAGKGEVSFSALGRDLEVPQANILRAIAGLEGHGLVETKEKGRLKKTALLTFKGKNLKNKIKDLAKKT